jgi:hypothetical protein
VKIEIKKTTTYKCEYRITRDDNSVEHIPLETKTYFVHDICHYVVEKNLAYSKGFWGMLSQGYSFKDLFGKDNILTTELRFIEQIVGPVQSVFLKNIQRKNFTLVIQHINVTMPEGMLDMCLIEIENIFKNWEQLSVGEHLILNWE